METQFKHTPGPWKYYRGGRNNYFVSGTEINEIATGIDDIDNAKLIAASPKILKALVKIIDAKDRAQKTEDLFEVLKEIDLARDLVKEATE